MFSLKRANECLDLVIEATDADASTVKELNNIKVELERTTKAHRVLNYEGDIYCPHCKENLWDCIENKSPYCPHCGTKVSFNPKNVKSLEG